MQDNIISENALSAMKDFLIDLRRDLHAHPELGFQEFRTSEKISSILDSLNIKYKNKVAETGIIADIEGEDKDFTIAFRADMDALPMEDKKNCSYSSQNKGKCHSCGHDVHTTVLTGIAKYFSEIKPPCNIRLIYQPAEETTGGALPMIKEHALDNVNVIYGLHVRPCKPAQECGTGLLALHPAVEAPAHGQAAGRSRFARAGVPACIGRP